LYKYKRYVLRDIMPFLSIACGMSLSFSLRFHSVLSHYIGWIMTPPHFSSGLKETYILMREPKIEISGSVYHHTHKNENKNK
jgi:hypothetical protein